MTVIAYKDGIMAADSWSVADNMHSPCVFPKIIRLQDGGLVGGAGYESDIWLANEWFRAGMPDEQPKFSADKEQRDALDLLWAKPDGSIWRNTHLVDGWYPQESGTAIGSAWQSAEIVMRLGAAAAAAVQFCIENCVGIGGPVQIERIGRV